MQSCDDDFSRAFFADANLNIIQRKLRDAVREKTGYVVDRQSDVELRGIMQGVYGAYAQTLGSVDDLNDAVLEIVVDQVVAGVDAYLLYLKDAASLPQPLSRGTFASIKGERTLEYKVGFK